MELQAKVCLGNKGYTILRKEDPFPPVSQWIMLWDKWNMQDNQGLAQNWKALKRMGGKSP